MSLNRYKPHVFVLPEDDADRQIANGFVLHPNLQERNIQILKPAGGWEKVLSTFVKAYVSEMRQYPEERIVLLLDFDRDENRLSAVNQQIPLDLKKRVFVLGVLSEPEDLKKDLNKSFEEIGETLAKDCSDNTNDLWGHKLLEHNNDELVRMISSVKPFLFKT